MNPEITLEGLANGYSSCEKVQPLSPEIIAALAATVTTQKTVTQLSAPVNARTIDNTVLGGGVENQTEFTFTNNTLLPITYFFTALFNEPGDAADFGITQNSAFDYPAAQGSGPHPENGGSDLRVFNKMAIANPGGFLIGQVEVTTSIGTGQQNQNLIIITEDVDNTPCSSTRLAPICDSCYNNAGSTTFTARFKCPLAVGGMMSFGYTVLPGETVTMRVTSIAQGIGQYKTLASAGCAC